MFLYKKELVKYCHKVYENKFVAATDGNLSVRLPDGNILITPSGKNKGDIGFEDLIVISPDGKKISGAGKPSSENKIHLLIYKSRPDINAVVHCHPVYATVLSITKNLFELPVLPEVILTLGKVPLCEYGTPSTDELPDSMRGYVKEANAFLLKNHGAVTSGKDMTEAYFRMEKLEHAAQILAIASGLGNINILSGSETDRLIDAAKNSYGPDLPYGYNR